MNFEDKETIMNFYEKVNKEDSIFWFNRREARDLLRALARYRGYYHCRCDACWSFFPSICSSDTCENCQRKQISK